MRGPETCCGKSLTYDRDLGLHPPSTLAERGWCQDVAVLDTGWVKGRKG